MDKFCSNCKYENFLANKEPCDGCFCDSEFTAKNWKAKELEDDYDEQYPDLNFDETFAQHGFTTFDGHLNLEFALEEIQSLYKNYGLEKDENLTEDAIKLKYKILDFVNKIKKL